MLNLANGVAQVPQMCNIKVTGYSRTNDSVDDTAPVCSKPFTYKPTSDIDVQEIAYTEPIKRCNNTWLAVFTFSLPGGSAAEASELELMLDSVQYTTCQS